MAENSMMEKCTCHAENSLCSSQNEVAKKRLQNNNKTGQRSCLSPSALCCVVVLDIKLFVLLVCLLRRFFHNGVDSWKADERNYGRKYEAKSRVHAFYAGNDGAYSFTRYPNAKPHAL